MNALVTLFALPGLVSSASLPISLATFDDKDTRSWHTENDPVMGGKSTSAWKLETGFGDYSGICAIVPALGAPGFTFAVTSQSPLAATYPDVSGADGMTLSVRNLNANITSFKLAFCDSRNPYTCQFATYKADFEVEATSADAEFMDVFVPWSKFSNKWSQTTGKHTAENPPKADSLKSITQLQIWTEGVAGTFHIQVDSIKATKAPALALLVSAPAFPVSLATFDEKDTRSWHTENDPVMGGKSKSAWKLETGFGDYSGICAIVPSLGAPGFTFAVTSQSPLVATYPDVSGADGVTLSVRNLNSNITSFKFAFCDSRNPYTCQFGTYKADFEVSYTSADADFADVFLPWSKFSNKWSQTTGKHTAENPPKADSLKSITQLQIWTEGVAGSFHIQVNSIEASKAASSILV